MLEEHWSEVVGNKSKGLFLKGPIGPLGVSGLQLRSNTIFTKLLSMTRHLAVFFDGKSIFEDFFFKFSRVLGGLLGVFRVLLGPKT